jgi:hypothetical protein
MYNRLFPSKSGEFFQHMVIKTKDNWANIYFSNNGTKIAV